MNEFQLWRISNIQTDTNRDSDGRLQVDSDGTIRWADAGAEKLFGYGVLKMQGLALEGLLASREENPLMPPLIDQLTRGGSCRLTFRHHKGYFFTALTRCPSPSDEPDTPQAYILSRGDMPLDGRVLRAAEGSAGLGIWELDALENRMFWSDGLFRLMELEPDQQIEPKHALFFFQEHQQQVNDALRQCRDQGTSFSMEVPVLTARQNRRWMRLVGHCLKDQDRVHAVTGTLVDITDLREQQQQASRWQHFTEGLLAASDDLMLILDTELKVVALNRAYREQFHRAFQVMPEVGNHLPSLLAQHPHERRLYQRLWERAMERDSFCVEMPLAHQDDQLPLYEIHFQRIFSPDGELLGAAHVGRTMASRGVVGNNQHHMNTHDPMTGLLNRRELLERLRRAITVNQSAGTPQALAYLDLDHFAVLNEQAGPSACDRYLRELGGLLQSRLRQRDAVARVAGDKFALVLDNCGPERARNVCDNIREAVKEFVFEWHGEIIRTTVSVGLVPLCTDPGQEAAACLALAADLCQSAKTAGPDRLHVHRDHDTARAETEARELLAQLEYAIRHDAIELQFQTIRPITSPTWGEHIEVLTRLSLPGKTPDDERVLWAPGDFLPIAERFDLACELDRRIIRKTLNWLKDQPQLEPRLKLISFNLSLASMEDSGFVPALAEMIGDTAFAPRCFCFEIRETDAVRYPESVERCCELLHQIGCRVALDNAGSSGQSYHLIARMPVDFIKFDRRLMQHLTSDPVQQVMVDALHRVAVVSGIETIAPFIESDAILRAVRQIGVHFGQGYWLASPQSLEQLGRQALQRQRP
ncbi:MAG: EAL domain-containing protein [Halomonadaceae bacterium]|nr:MAG: EAL domain-containing protein [Halomonadaceae bacterium]